MPKIDHNGRDPVPELVGGPVSGEKRLEEEEADADAGESTMGQGVAKKGHTSADDQEPTPPQQRLTRTSAIYARTCIGEEKKLESAKFWLKA